MFQLSFIALLQETKQSDDSIALTLAPHLDTPEKRTSAVAGGERNQPWSIRRQC